MSEPETSDKIDHSTQITIARWTDRFYAWLIDYIIVFAASFAVFFAAFTTTNFETMINGNFEYTRSYEFAPISVVFFAYWIILEYRTGQSIGKMALHLKTTNLKGQKVDFKSILISSFGKAFILPIDVILGWIFTNQKRQRIFNRLGSTIVIKLEKAEEEPENISYKKD